VNEQGNVYELITNHFFLFLLLFFQYQSLFPFWNISPPFLLLLPGQQFPLQSLQVTDNNSTVCPHPSPWHKLSINSTYSQFFYSSVNDAHCTVIILLSTSQWCDQSTCPQYRDQGQGIRVWGRGQSSCLWKRGQDRGSRPRRARPRQQGSWLVGL